jgi:hypothetical protein
MLTLKALTVVFLCGSLFWGPLATDAMAKVETTFLYRLSGFGGTIPYSQISIFADEKRSEIYVADPRERDIRIFNDRGMEVYRFGDDGRFGTVVDIAVDGEGDILVLARKASKFVIHVCNFRGEPVSELALKNPPADFAGFSPNRIVYRHGQLYLVNTAALKIVVTDENGVFRRGYDVGDLAGIEDKDRDKTDMAGFSVDPQGNMLFTIPVLFSAFQLTPDGKLAAFGTPGSAPGKFNLVAGIVADDRGYVYVADRLKSVIQIFDPNFRFQRQFGYRGRGPQNLIAPNNLVLDAQNRLYVSQMGQVGVSVFKITHDQPEPAGTNSK